MVTFQLTELRPRQGIDSPKGTKNGGREEMPGGGSETGVGWGGEDGQHLPTPCEPPEGPGPEPWRMPAFSHFPASALSPVKVPQEIR